MKNLITITLFALTVFACGTDDNAPTEKTVPAVHDHPDMVDADHDHPGLVSINHEHPDSDIITADAATGRYEVTVALTSSSCSDEGAVFPEEEESAGEWIVAMTSDEYILFTENFMLTSTDGSVFSAHVEQYSYYCNSEVYDFSIPLTFTETNFFGEYIKQYSATDCMTGVNEEGIPTVENVECTLTWDFTGTRL